MFILLQGKEPKMNVGQQIQVEGKILCRICGDSAVRHVHYGGHCCFSCKAFFRQKYLLNKVEGETRVGSARHIQSKKKVTPRYGNTTGPKNVSKVMFDSFSPKHFLPPEKVKNKSKCCMVKNYTQYCTLKHHPLICHPHLKLKTLLS